MAITKAQAIDILDKFEFFQGQRAGRELWSIKPFDVQDQDIKDFSRDVALLKEYICDAVPASEVAKEFTCFVGDPHKVKHCPYLEEAEKVRSEVSREIFEEVERIIDKKYNRFVFKDQPYDSDEEIDAIINYSDSVSDAITELKKKYTEGAE